MNVKTIRYVTKTDLPENLWLVVETLTDYLNANPENLGSVVECFVDALHLGHYMGECDVTDDTCASWVTLGGYLTENDCSLLIEIL